MTKTWFDITYAVSIVSRFVNNLAKKHIAVMKCIFSNIIL